MKTLNALIACSLLILAQGCASIAPEDRPEVSLVGIEIVDVTPFQTTLQLDLRILNPSKTALTVDGADFAVSLGMIKIGRGVSHQRVEIPGLDSSILGVNFHVNNIALATRLIPAFEEGEISYTMKSRLHLVDSFKSQIKHEGGGVLDLGDGRTSLAEQFNSLQPGS